MKAQRHGRQVNKFLEKRAKSQFETDQLSGALLLGAQAVNAEGVPFSGRVDHNLLLHFWQVVVLTFLPRVVNKKDGKTERYGYVLAIPDVSDLKAFRKEFPRLLGSLRGDPSMRLPAAANVDLPEQANLEVLRRLKGQDGEDRHTRSAVRAVGRTRQTSGARGGIQALAADRALAEGGCASVGALEPYHLVKLGNNIKLVAFARVTDRPGLTEEYSRIERSFRNPLFRAARMRALIQGEPWHAGMIELFAEYPWPFFIEGDDTPKYLARFGRDANDQLRAIAKDYEDISDMKHEELPEEERLKHLSVIIRRVV